MDTYLLFLSLLPLIGVNIWHTLLLVKRSKDGRPHSISQHATETPELLRTHRLMHTSASVILIAFAIGFLIPNGYLLAACLLITGAIFDVLEVVTLNKRNAAETFRLNSHTTTAWSMAVFYLLYASVIISVAKLSPFFVIAAWLTPAILAVLFNLRKFNGFWIAQHMYFCLLALALVIAHVRLVAN